MDDPNPSGVPEAEIRLMERVAAGDRSAFETLYENSAATVMAFLVGLCRDRQLAEDLTQETYLRAWVAAPRWRPRARVSTWLLGIAKRLAWKRLRRRARRPLVEAASADRRTSSAAPGGATERADEVARLEAALTRLAPPYRAVFVLVRLLDRPYAEVAQILRLPVGTVKSRMATAENRLRHDLDA